MYLLLKAAKVGIKEHIHALIRLSSLKEEYNADNIESIIREVCLSLDEVNNHIPDSVMVRTFLTWRTNIRLLETVSIICVNPAPNIITRSYEPLKTALLLTLKHYEEEQTKTFHISFDENNEDLYFEIMRESTRNLVPVAALQDTI